MKALVYERSVPRYLAANVVSRLTGGPAAHLGPVQLQDIEPQGLPNDHWHHVQPVLSGICGSDLDAVSGNSSRYFEAIQSFPFVLGHEIVGRLDDGTRVVIEPALGCAVRGIHPMCPSCSSGFAGTCHNLTNGDIKGGVQSGYCASTGGGWSERMVAHSSQIHVVPDAISDEAAVIVEPAACAVHAVHRGGGGGNTVAVIGAGTLGLLTLAALQRYSTAAFVAVGAKYPHQRKLAARLGATKVVPPADLGRAVRLATGSLMNGHQLTGGADVVFDCIGTSASITQSLQIVRPGGRVVLVGMPGPVNVDLAPLWNREVELLGAYCYGVAPDGRRDFEIAMELVQAADLGHLVSATYPLTRYRDAIEHAANAGGRGAVKIAFDLRSKESN